MPLRPADLRGAARLATEATLALTDLVEAMHERVARVPLVGRPSPDGRMGGISGLVYRSVRGVTRLAGGGVDALLELIGAALPANDTTRDREAIVAALNGVLGDHLAETGNPLATTMSLRHGGMALDLRRASLAAALPAAGPKLLVMLHGLCMNDLQWTRAGHDHGAALQRDLDYTPVYLRYNSGLHISTNADALARLLERLVDAWPVPLRRLVLVGHSMGGLLARSAVQAASTAGLRWPARLDDLVFLGTPHHGAPLERAGNWIDIALGATPYAAPLARLGKVRSAGITDLRHANLVDADWNGLDRFARTDDRPAPLPLPDGVRCHALAATTGEYRGAPLDRLIGDGLVPVASALGRHADPNRCLAFPPDRQCVVERTNHLDLLGSPEAYAHLRRWLA